MTTTFYKKDGIYFVRTDGPEGKLHNYVIAYTFGTEPLQKYLVKFPGGRLQALSIAWDGRRKSEGGQRWFHLYPSEAVDHKDPLHWSGINQNWNFMCADCHSTNLQKNYDLNSDTYQTRWSEINVACEACHGPASRHVHWSNSEQSTTEGTGFAIRLRGFTESNWEMDFQRGTARNMASAGSRTELQICARCHSRRSTHLPGPTADSKLLDHFNLSLLQPPLYHADGQIREEVYVYGSFLQSRMYKAGVTCSNCHEPHSLQLRSSGDGICTQCHLTTKFARAAHHFHPDDSPAARCVNCHMPAKRYMQVDNRHDHSFRIPRPDLSDSLQTPNACINCHRDKSNRWAAETLRARFGPPERPHFGEALHAGIHGTPGAETKLIKLIQNPSQPAIARATAVTLLPRYLSRRSAQRLQAIAQGTEPLTSFALAQSLGTLPSRLRPVLGIPLLFKPEQATRSLAANALASVPMDHYPAQVQEQFSQALRDYATSALHNSDRPESLVNLGGLHLQRGSSRQAEAFYLRAIDKAPYYAPAYVNLADLYRIQRREMDAEQLLRNALDSVKGKAAIQHTLGLSLIRQNRHSEAMVYLQQSAQASDTHSRYIYTFGIALHSAGNSERALEVLEKGLSRFPGTTEIVQALASMNREYGNSAKAQQYEALLADH